MASPGKNRCTIIYITVNTSFFYHLTTNMQQYAALTVQAGNLPTLQD